MKRFFFVILSAILAACTLIGMESPTPTSTSTLPTLAPTATECPWELIPPAFTQIEPNLVSPGEQFKLVSSGGYLRDSCGGINESVRSFDVYLDDQPIGEIMCYVNHCEGDFILPPDTQAGTHCISTRPGVCDLEIQVAMR
jgi:hypothetical protein